MTDAIDEALNPANQVAVQKAKAPAKAKAEAAAEVLADGFVRCRVTKKGGGEVPKEKGGARISTGEHIPGKGDVYHAWKDIITVPLETALKLEERGLIEIED